MSDLNNSTKQKLEHLFNMKTGYVLDFTNASFADFIMTSTGIDIYGEYEGSKAQILRQFWQQEDNKTVAKLTIEMLDRWETNKLMNKEEISNNEKILHEQCRNLIQKMQATEDVEKNDKSDLAFLKKDFGNLDISKLDVSIDMKTIMEQRLKEIDICLKLKACLATIFLCGSTLEGLLFEVANKNPKKFNESMAAPKKSGFVKALNEWTLEELINVCRDLNIIGEDVKKYAHAVKDFRNYIHPRQQLKESFLPRSITAEMSHKVLLAAMTDLGAIK